MSEPELTSLPIHHFLDRLASAAPTPGGGSAAALAGALAASLVCMVCNLTIGRETLAEFEDHARLILQRAEATAAQLRSAISADAAAYSAVIAARRLPRGSTDEQADRRRIIQTATVEAARVPLDISRACRDVLGLCEDAMGVTNPHAASDIMVAALLAGAGIEAAAASVEINLATLRDEELAEEMRRQLATFRAGREERVRAILERVREQF